MIHRTALWTVRAEETDRMKAMQAEKKAATTTPASSSTRTSRGRPVAVATPKTITIAKSAPANAASGSVHEVAPAHPSESTSTAPTDAPPEIPRI